MRNVIRLRDTRIPFGLYEGWTLEEVADENVGYLDWLAGQSWLYGDFERRLYAFLKHPRVQAQLDEALPDEERKDSEMPLFFSGEVAKLACRVDCPMNDKWHGQTMPKDDQEDRDWRPPRRGPWQAYDQLASIIIACGRCRTYEDYAGLMDLAPQMKTLVSFLSPKDAKSVRAHYLRARKRAKAMKRLGVVSWEAYTDPHAALDNMRRLGPRQGQRFANRMKKQAPELYTRLEQCLRDRRRLATVICKRLA